MLDGQVIHAFALSCQQHEGQEVCSLAFQQLHACPSALCAWPPNSGDMNAFSGFTYDCLHVLCCAGTTRSAQPGCGAMRIMDVQ